MAAHASPARAFGFGNIAVASELGQPLRASVAVIGNDVMTQIGACFTSRVSSANGSLIANSTTRVTPTAQGALLAFATSERITEPAASLIVETTCGTAMRREFALLLNPPMSRFLLPADQQSDAQAAIRPIAYATLRGSLPMQHSSTPRMRNALMINLTNATETASLKKIGLLLEPTNRLTLKKLAEEPVSAAAVEQTPEKPKQSVERENTQQIQEEQDMNRHLLAIVGGVLALSLVLSLAIIALLRGRVKPQKQPVFIGDWDDATADSKADREPTFQDEAVLQNSPAPVLVKVASVVPLPQTIAPMPATPAMAATPDGEHPLALDPMVIGPIHQYKPYDGNLQIPSTAPVPAAAVNYSKTTAKVPLPSRHEDMNFPELPFVSTALEEVSDAMEEAEFWISLKELTRAVEVLEPYANVRQAGSPLPWLYLFELYMELDNREKYDVLREQFHRVYNARILTWEDQARSDTTLPESTIDDVPHVQSRITSLWSSEEIVPYLESLLIDDRYGTRVGFQLSIFREIMFLITLANTSRASDIASTVEPRLAGWTIQA